MQLNKPNIKSGFTNASPAKSGFGWIWGN